MGSISLPVMGYIAMAGAAVSAGASAYESHEQGVATKNADQAKARVEALNGAQKQIDMRQNMLRALASQNAGSLGAVGTGGSFGANTQRQINQAQNDIMVNDTNTSSQVSLLDQAGSNAEAAGNIGAAADLGGGVYKVAGMA